MDESVYGLVIKDKKKGQQEVSVLKGLPEGTGTLPHVVV